MGLLDSAFDVLKGGADAARGVASDAGEFVGDAKSFLERTLGVDITKGPGPLDRLPFVHDNPLVKLAGSPILGAAQLQIAGMKATTGSGQPEEGDDFETSADSFEDAGNILIDAGPKDDRWNGTAATTYERKNNQQRHLTLGVAYADRDMRRILRDEAEQVGKTRETLSELSDFLADFDLSTSWMNYVPGGAAAKAVLDMSVAAANVGAAEFAIAKLVRDSFENAGKVREQMEAYRNAAAEEVLDTTACAPFGDEHRGGVLPKRIQPDESFTPPEPEGPPVVYPPATPYDSSPPTAP